MNEIVTYATLEDSEAVIEDFQRRYVLVGQALLDIFEGELWHEQDYHSWEGYLEQRWQMKKSRASQLLNCGRFVRALALYDASLPVPANETQVRGLMQVRAMRDEEETKTWERRAGAWRIVLDESAKLGREITREFVEDVVFKFLRGGERVRKRDGKPYDARASLELAFEAIANCPKTVGELAEDEVDVAALSCFHEALDFMKDAAALELT